MAQPSVQIDIVIIGGGIAGLWALNLLRNRGYSVLLLEQHTLGSSQTINSQGMIHGGMKYALGGSLNAGSESLANMPRLWRDCLTGRGPVNLTDCDVLSEQFYLWSSGSLGARLTGFFASKLLRGRVQALSPGHYPQALQHPDFTGQVYQLTDLVLDVPSLVRKLAGNHADAIFSIDWRRATLRPRERQATLVLPGLCLEPECLLLTAGCGNEALIQALGGSGPAMQRRPLQQVLVRHDYTEPLFGHCIGSGPSPRLTISSHRTGDGKPVWYLGGDLATAGAGETAQQLIDRARAELRLLLPWIDLGDCEWRTVAVDRAEPRQPGMLRPDGAFVAPVQGVDNALVAWPTKLTLAPQLGSAVENLLQQRGILPRHRPDLSGLTGAPRPGFAAPCWEALFQ